MMHKKTAHRFWAKVNKGDFCWLWTGARSTAGYGQLRVDCKTVYAHRLVWEEINGPIPAGLFVCHHCDVPACVRPDHLFLGSCSDNVQDMRQKGRQVNGGARGEKQGLSKLSSDLVIEIRKLWALGVTAVTLGQSFKVDTTTAHRAATGRTWKHV